MSWRKNFAYGWISTVAAVVGTALTYGIFMAIWESEEPWFWLGFIAFIGISSWATYELMVME